MPPAEKGALDLERSRYNLNATETEEAPHE
jgi:hypothetical protein